MDYEALSIVAGTFLFSYLIGAIPFGLIFTKLFTKDDLRKIGSGNIGATNVLRTGNKKLAALTLLCDAIKGAAVIMFITGGIPSLAKHDIFFGPEFLIKVGLFIGIAAILGHCYPIWLKFKGGKGVATALGVLLCAVPISGALACTIWLASAVAFRISSLSALIAIWLTPLITMYFYGVTPAVLTLIVAAIIFWRHRENISRLLSGTEPKIGQKKE